MDFEINIVELSGKTCESLEGSTKIYLQRAKLKFVSKSFTSD